MHDDKTVKIKAWMHCLSNKISITVIQYKDCSSETTVWKTTFTVRITYNIHITQQKYRNDKAKQNRFTRERKKKGRNSKGPTKTYINQANSHSADNKAILCKIAVVSQNTKPKISY